jgi:hypothetical protein
VSVLMSKMIFGSNTPPPKKNKKNKNKNPSTLMTFLTAACCP